jgi:phage-related protein
MRSIDERIVDMQFNNKQFEDGISQSLGSIDSLKKGLGNMDGNGALEGIAKGVDTLTERFSALGIIAITALQNITNRAVDAGIEITKSLTVDQVTAGWTKYEQKTASVQTIMNSTGKSIDEVNEYLNKLMWFSDETSYGFTDMTAALAQMTSSGGDIDNLIPLITGVANATAYAGKGAAEFSRSMYNLNQSYGAGSLQYQDWKSLELAGVAGKELKQVFIDVGVAMGKIEEGEVTIGNFGTTLKDKWADTSVMEAAFGKFSELSEEAYKLVDSEQFSTAAEAIEFLSGKYSDLAEKAFKSAQQAKSFTEAIDATKDAVSSGWMNTFEIIFGDYEEATVLWTNVANELWNVFASGAEARNEMLAAWKDLGGRDDLLEAFSNLYNGIKSIIAPVKEAFQQIFPPMTTEKLFAFTEGLKEFTAKLTISDETADKLKRTFAGLFSILGFVGDAFKFLFGVVGEVLGVLSPVGGGFLEVTATIGDFLVALREGGTVGDVFKKGLEGIRTFLEWSADGVQAAVEKIKHWFGQFGGIDVGPIAVFSDKTKVAFKPFTFILETAQKAFEGIKKVFDWVAPYFLTFATKCREAFSKIGEVFGKATGVTGFDGFLELINKLLTGGILIKLGQMLGDLKEMTSGASGFLANITGILDGVRGSLEAYQNKLKSQAILNIAIAIGVLAAALWVLSTIPANELEAGLTAITILFVELSAVMIVMSKAMGSVKLGRIAVQMVAISLATLILSAACKNLSGLTWKEMARGLLGVAGLLGALIAFEKLIGNGKGLMKIGLALIPLSTGLLILSGAMKIMATMSWEELAKGLVGIGGALVAVATVSKLVKPGPILAMGAAMVGLGVGMVAMAGATAILSNLSWEGLLKGLTGIAGVLTMVAVASKLISPATLLAMGVAMVGVGAAMNLMATAMLIMGQMSWEQIAKSLVALAGALTVLAIATKLMSGSIAGAAALLAISAALAILVPSLVILGMMDLNNIAMMLLVLVGVFGTFAVAAMLLAPITPVMLALGGSIALLGVGILALGAGLMLCATAMTAFAVAGTAGAVALTAMVTSLIGLIPMTIKNIGEGLVLLVGTLVEAIPGVLTIIGMLLEGIIALIIEYTPQLMVMLGVLLTEVLALLLEYIPKIVDVALQMIVGILNAIAENIDDIVTAAVSIVIALLKGITENIPKIIDTIFEMLEEIARQIGLFIPRLVSLGFEMIISFLNGMADTIRENVPKMVDAAWNMIEAIVDGIVYALEVGVPKLKEQMKRVADALWKAFKEFFGIHSPSTLAQDGAGMIIQGIINGLAGGVTAVVNKIKDVASAIWNGFKNFFGIKSPSTLMETEGGQVTAGVKKGIEGSQSSLVNTAINVGKAVFDGIKGAVSDIGSVANNVVSTLGNGLKNGISEIASAAKNIGNSILSGVKGVLGINSPAKTMIKAAHYTGQGFIVGMKDMMSPVANAAEDMGDGAINAMKDSLSMVSDVMDSDMNLTPTIRPVIDMSDIENGINSAFSKEQSLNVGEIKGKAATVSAATRQNGDASSGDTNNDNAYNSQIQVVNHFHVRNDTDIQKINTGLNNLITKFQRTQGTVVMQGG